MRYIATLVHTALCHLARGKEEGEGERGGLQWFSQQLRLLLRMEARPPLGEPPFPSEESPLLSSSFFRVRRYIARKKGKDDRRGDPSFYDVARERIPLFHSTHSHASLHECMEVSHRIAAFWYKMLPRKEKMKKKILVGISRQKQKYFAKKIFKNRKSLENQLDG